MTESSASTCIAALQNRALPGGGFAARDGAGYRTDATAWAVIALAAAGSLPALLEPARARLAQDQLPDGRVPISPEHPEAHWPTPLALLAWHRAAAQQAAQSRAVRFLLGTTGKHWRRRADEPLANDPDIKGWPWIGGTHSWVGSTGLTVIALRVAGQGSHPRVAEGLRLILDRQLPTGGWNYGNTRVFDTELRPMPESTGIALSALPSRTPRESLERSLAYLKAALPAVRTPYSLAWGLLGLGAWQERPAAAQAFIAESLARQERYGSYDTTSLALLLLAHLAPGGLQTVFPVNQDFASPQPG
jgi:hypothetical protein